MMRWIWLKLALLSAVLAPLPGAASSHTAVPAGSSGTPYGYYRYLPDGYDSGTGEWAVVIFLHGAGEVGDGSSNALPSVLALGLPRTIEDGADYAAIVISPQTPGNWDVGTLDTLIDYIKVAYRVDLDRIYLTGASLGGGGVWNYAKTYPQKLAAILPVAATLSTPNGSALASLPTWVFHSWGDTNANTPPGGAVDWSNAIAQAISGTPSDVMASYPGTYSGLPALGQTSDLDRTASYDAGTASWTWEDGVPADLTGTHPNLTLYSGTSHDSWTATYNNADVLDWLLAQDRGLCPGVSATRLIVPTAAGAATGGGSFPLGNAFDAQPTLRSGCEPVGGSNGSDAPTLSGGVGYIDFGPEWEQVRITETWTRYRAWSSGSQTPYSELWWDDDTDSINDSLLAETGVNFNTAQNLNTGPPERWLRDRDLRSSPAAPQARYLLMRAPAGMTDRAKEYAILGYEEDEPDYQRIAPASAGTASGSIYFPMEDAFDSQPTLNGNFEPEGGSGGNQAPYLSNRVGYIDFGPEWYKVRITATWTQYRTWSTGAQTPYAELWWDDDTDSVNDSLLTETDVNFNTAGQSLNTGMTEPWLRDRDLLSSPVAPQARYLLCRSHSSMTDRAKEYAIVGFIDPNATP